MTRVPEEEGGEGLSPSQNLSSSPAKDAGIKSLSAREQSDYLQCVLNAAKYTPLIATDLEFHIRFFNSAAKTLYGYEHEVVEGKHLREVTALGLATAEKFDRAVASLKQEQMFRYQVEHKQPDEYRLIEGYITSLFNQSDEQIGYVLNGQDITRLTQQQERLSRKAAEEQCLGDLLRLSLGRLGTETFLQKSLETLLTSIPWLNLLPQGAVFLSDWVASRRALKMVAQVGLCGRVIESCDRIPYGYCVCGRSAQSGELIYVADSNDQQHEVSYPGMEPHGHYVVPILNSGSTIGVLTLYIPPYHTNRESDRAFLKRISSVLSIGIARRRTERELEYQARHDELTALPNRNQLTLQLEKELSRARRHGQVGALMFIDLDHFKHINESLGHSVGDGVLRDVANRLVGLLRKEDTVARLGGDEFVVLLAEEEGTPRQVARLSQRVAEKIRDTLSQSYRVDDYTLNITPSIGVVLFPEEEQTASEILKQADTAMYQAKAEGRNCIRFFLPVMQMLADERLAVEQDLRRGIDRGLLEVHFQPQVDGKGNVIGAEALLRCPNQEGSYHRTDLCIEVAETTGLILPIGEWVLEASCRYLHNWQQQGLADQFQHLCVNISPKQFLQRDFVSRVQRVLSQTGISPGMVVLEITESTLIDAKRDAIDTMRALKELGLRIAIDDFGTGYSSLSYLTQLPLDMLKIDRSFVSCVHVNPKNAAVAEALMVMARQLGLSVVAEGVETIEEHNFLLSRVCDCFQGYYYGRPEPAQRFAQRLQLAVLD